VSQYKHILNATCIHKQPNVNNLNKQFLPHCVIVAIEFVIQSEAQKQHWTSFLLIHKFLADNYCSCIPDNLHFHLKILHHSKHFSVGSCYYNYDYSFVNADNGDGAAVGGGGGGTGGNLHYMLISDQHILSAKKIILLHGTIPKISKINSTLIKVKQLRAKRLPPLTTSNSKQSQSFV